MAIYFDQVGRRITGQPFSWGPNDGSLYALSVGASSDGASGLEFTTADANSAAAVLPSFAVILTMKSASSPITHVGDFPLSKIIHAGQEVLLRRPLPTSGTGIGTTEVTGIFDTGKHAIIETTTSLRAVDVTTGSGEENTQEFAQTKSTILVLGEGDFGGAKPPQKPARPTGKPHGNASFRTTPNQALLYRLNGDRNPLHFDTPTATAAGFERPILHGLCTFGIVSRLLLEEICPDAPACFESFSARFVKPVYPGAVLDTAWWHSGSTVHFQVETDGEVVLDSGTFALRQ